MTTAKEILKGVGIIGLTILSAYAEYNSTEEEKKIRALERERTKLENMDDDEKLKWVIEHVVDARIEEIDQEIEDLRNEEKEEESE